MIASSPSSWMRVAVAMTVLFTSAARLAGGDGVSRGDALAAQTRVSTGQGQLTIWDSVFTEAQAARGQRSYRRACGQCHSDDLSGGGDGEPALAGVIFLAQWRNRRMADLFEVISETMPYSAPGRLQREEYVDIVSYLLRANGAPAGPVELSHDREQLKQILITDPERDYRPRP
jgi:mono/diheme cytochrome c family protein